MTTRQQFPLFNTPLDLAHSLWKGILQEGDVVIDATCGNGKDSVTLAKWLEKKRGSSLFCIDIQEQALFTTKEALRRETPSFFPNVTFLLQSHANLPKVSPLRLVVYNLGYLPGGDKTLTTHTSSTLESLENACSLLAPGGLISITCYVGHPEGKREEEALLAHFSSLPPKEWNLTHTRWLNRSLAPSLLLLQRSL